MKKIYIILAGPPKAGKSFTSKKIYNSLSKRGKSFFLQRLNPDSEGMWTSEENMVLARNLKNRLKENGNFFNQAQIEFWLKSINNLHKNFDIVVFDLGGMPSKENEILIKEMLKQPVKVISIVLVKRNGEDGGFIEFMNRLGVRVFKKKAI